MALADVLERITKDGEEELARIEKEASDTVRSIERATTEELEHATKESGATRTRRCEKVRERILADARRSKRFMHEAHMQHAIALVTEELFNVVSTMNTEEYTALLAATLEEMGEDVKSAQYVIAQERGEETRNILLARGVPEGAIATAEKAGMLGGFEARTAKRVYTVVLSEYAQSLAEKKRTDIAAAIVRVSSKK